MDAGRSQLDGTTPRVEIEQSWWRSQMAGLRPEMNLDRLRVGDVDGSSRLLAAARPVLEDMAVRLAGTRFCVVLGDHEGRIVYRWFDSNALERALDDISAVVGSVYAEDSAGTNGIGTPIEVRRGVVVHGREHYLDALKGFSCYGRPLTHPVTRRIEGVLDITGITADANPLLAPFLDRAAADIEARLLEGSRQSEQLLLRAFQVAARRQPRAVAVLGDELVLTNKAAVELLDASDHGVLRALATGESQLEMWTRHVRLSSGVTARVTAERIAGTGGGTLLRLDPIERASPAAVPSQGRAGRLVRRRLAVHVAGEPGSGRTWQVHDIARRHCGRDPDTLAVLDATDVATGGERAWAVRLHELAEHPVLVIEEIQLLPEALCTLLGKIISARPNAVTLLTSGPSDELSPLTASLVAHCADRVELAPLRNRLDELPALARTMLTELHPGADLRLTPGAIEALAAQPWHGNLRELATVLRQVADRRTSGDISVADLPVSHRAVSRASRLGGLERAERAAIIEALRVTSGNKAKAALRLGISRTTLYNRMRALGIAG